MTFPSDLKYTKEHEWVKLEGSTAIIGVTDYAIEQLGDVVYLDLPQAGTELNAHDTLGTIESTKTVSDLYAPLSCKVLESNQNIVDNPDSLTKDAYKEGWLVKVEVTEELPDSLLSAEDYQKYIKQL